MTMGSYGCRWTTTDEDFEEKRYERDDVPSTTSQAPRTFASTRSEYASTGFVDGDDDVDDEWLEVTSRRSKHAKRTLDDNSNSDLLTKTARMSPSAEARTQHCGVALQLTSPGPCPNYRAFPSLCLPRSPLVSQGPCERSCCYGGG
jgi:hypothetical protein